METLYVRNLNEKLNLTKLSSELRSECEKYGTVLDIVVRKNLKMRGQAFVVFDTAQQAQAALTALQGQEFHGKPIDAAFAKTKSDATVEKSGSEALAQHKQKRGSSSTLKRSASEPASEPGAAKKPKSAENTMPHKILFIEDLPTDVTLDALTAIYRSLKGFVEVRLVAARGVAFVEFTAEPEASMGLKLPVEINGQRAYVSYAKR